MPSRKPSRTIPTVRCPLCQMRSELCICSLIPRLELSTRLVLIMHSLEKKSTTNTGRIAHLALPNSELRIWGRHLSPMDTLGLTSSTHATLLLYPSDNAQLLTAEFLATLKKPVRLIVPDGTWRQASKMARRIPELAGLPRIKLPPRPASQYGLRQRPNEGSMATLEAIACALGVIEGTVVQTQLETVLSVMVRRTLASRGTLHQS
jgi:DTW domain-containing protein YfiP